jgi:hypothetical protein
MKRHLPTLVGCLVLAALLAWLKPPIQVSQYHLATTVPGRVCLGLILFALFVWSCVAVIWGVGWAVRKVFHL